MQTCRVVPHPSSEIQSREAFLIHELAVSKVCFPPLFGCVCESSKGPRAVYFMLKMSSHLCAVIVLINKWGDESPAVWAVHVDNALLLWVHLYSAASRSAFPQTSLHTLAHLGENPSNQTCWLQSIWSFFSHWLFFFLSLPRVFHVKIWTARYRTCDPRAEWCDGIILILW